MAKSWHYPRWRRVLMQLSLWAIFGATVSMAAWVVRERNPGGAGEWGPTLTTAGVAVRLPRGWEVTPGEAPNVLLQAAEAAPGGPAGEDDTAGRTFIVQQFAVKPGESARAFLITGGPLDNAMIVENGVGIGGSPAADDALPTRPVQIGPVPGIMLQVLRSVAATPGQPMSRLNEWIACGIEPGGTHVVVLRLQRFSETAPESDPEPDDALLARLAAAVGFRHVAP